MSLRFDLHQLGWFAFEQLSRTICREVYGQPVEAYSRGPDGGVDGALLGPWHLDGRVAPAVLQSKHRSDPRVHLALRDVEREFPKLARHVDAGECDVYVLMTNAKVSATTAADVKAELRSVGVKHVIIHGYEAVCELLGEHKQLRAQVPRLYGLGDLTEILDERAYAQAQAVLAAMHDDLARIVPVAAHRAAHQALGEHRFTLLLGPPGSGKTAIAASLAVGALDLNGVRVVKLDRPSQLTDRWNPNDPRQLFWLDDAFGATSFDQTTAEEWNRVTRSLEAALRGGAHMIATSRDYVYAAAKDHLKPGGFPRLHEATVVIEVEDLTTVEREQILYNHLRLGRQPPSWLQQLDPRTLEVVAAHERFLPELARRLAEPLFTTKLNPPTTPALIDFTARPQEFLGEVLIGLDSPSRAALGLVHLRGGTPSSPYEPVPGDEEFLARVGTTLSTCLRALPKLEGSLLRLVNQDGGRWWEFHHPSLTDAYRTWLAGEPELLREYLMSAPPEELVRTTTCGNMGLAGALIVPRALNVMVADRLLDVERPAVYEEAWRWQQSLRSFLAFRCDDEFLRAWLERDPGLLIAAFHPGLYLSVHTSLRDLAARLLDAGIADDDHRRALVAELREYALNAADASFLTDDRWLRFFTADELAELDNEIRTQVLPHLADLIRDELDAIWDAAPEPSTDETSATLDAYAARYPGEYDQQIEDVREIMGRYERREDPTDDDWRFDTKAHPASAPHASVANRSVGRRGPHRSVFDYLVEA